MSQMTIYMPQELQQKLQRAAKESKQSVSSFIANIIAREVRPQRWPKQFVAVLGKWRGRFDEPKDPPPADIYLDVHP